jgi:phage shock protein A
MTHRVLIATLTVAGVLAGGAGSALAGAEPPGSPDPAVACARAEQRLEQLQGISERLANRIANVEQRLAGAELTERQENRAERLLARLERRLGKLEQRIEKLSAAIDERCTSATSA